MTQMKPNGEPHDYVYNIVSLFLSFFLSSFLCCPFKAQKSKGGNERTEARRSFKSSDTCSHLTRDTRLAPPHKQTDSIYIYHKYTGFIIKCNAYYNDEISCMELSLVPTF